MDVLYPFIAFFALVAIEFLVSRTWAGAYYRFGVPGFRVRLPGVRVDADTEKKIDTTVNHRVSLITYQRLSESEIAFREKGNASVTFRYIPPFHGLIRYVPEEGATYVIGWINFFMIVAVAGVAWMFFESPRFRRPWDFVIFFVLIVGTMFAIGVWRYRMVVKSLRTTSE